MQHQLKKGRKNKGGQEQVALVKRGQNGKHMSKEGWMGQHKLKKGQDRECEIREAWMDQHTSRKGSMEKPIQERAGGCNRSKVRAE